MKKHLTTLFIVLPFSIFSQTSLKFTHDGNNRLLGYVLNDTLAVGFHYDETGNRTSKNGEIPMEIQKKHEQQTLPYLFPNPFDGNFTVSIPKNEIIKSIQVFDILGNELEATEQLNFNTGTIDLKNRAFKGIVLCKVYNEKNELYFLRGIKF